MEDANINGTLSTPLANTTTGNVTQTPGFPEYLLQPLGALVFQITLWSTIVFLGVIGNLLVCFVILSQAKMKNSMNYYLLSLAIADLGVLLIIYPMAVLKYFSPFRWLLGKHGCHYLYPTVEMFFGASIWSITAIAIERYRNIVGAKRYQIRRRSRVTSTFVVIGVVWLASFLFSSVPLYPVMAYDPNRGSCLPAMPSLIFQCYSIVLIVVWYALPLVVIAITYASIKKQVLQSAAFQTSMLEYNDRNQAVLRASSKKERIHKSIWRQSNKTTRILTPVVILFAVTMFPLNAFRVMALIMPEYWKKSYYNLVIGQLIMFIMINSSANPLVYYITSKEFKVAFKEILTSLKDKKNVLKRLSGKSKPSWRTSPSVLDAASADRGENQGRTKKSNNEPQTELPNGNIHIVTAV